MNNLDVNGTKNFLHYLGNLFKEILPMDSGARIQEHVLKRKKINGGWEYHTCRTFCAEVLVSLAFKNFFLFLC